MEDCTSSSVLYMIYYKATQRKYTLRCCPRSFTHWKCLKGYMPPKCHRHWLKWARNWVYGTTFNRTSRTIWLHYRDVVDKMYAFAAFNDFVNHIGNVIYIASSLVYIVYTQTILQTSRNAACRYVIVYSSLKRNMHALNVKLCCVFHIAYFFYFNIWKMSPLIAQKKVRVLICIHSIDILGLWFPGLSLR